jgi:hypothetical protein
LPWFSINRSAYSMGTLIWLDSIVAIVALSVYVK